MTPSTKKRPTLETERLILRPFELSDAPRVQLLAGDRDVAAMTKNIPHPYDDGLADAWIGSHQERFEKREEAVFAITLDKSGELIGAVGLILKLDQEIGELGYWIGKPYWSRGYCTEAARAVLHFAFTEFRLNRVHARHFSHNPVLGRVMQKVGMRREGRLRQHVKKCGEFFDVEAYGSCVQNMPVLDAISMLNAQDTTRHGVAAPILVSAVVQRTAAFAAFQAFS